MATATIGRGMTAARASQARQKKILIGGAALLAVVLVIQVPRTMKMIGGSETATPAPAAPLPSALTPTPSAPTPTPTTAPVADGKLVSFERFRSKDPFIQQVSAVAEAPPTKKTEPAATGGPSEQTNEGSKAETTALPTAFKTNEGSATPTSATIKINGVNETVGASKTFPKADPVFKLVSLTASRAEIGIADGSFKSGGKTITLELGEPVTLMNTADGKRYKLELVSTSD